MSKGARKKRATRPWQNPDALRGIGDLLTPTAYDQVRRSRPELGLPRTATVASACGGWDRALREAEKHASELLRQRG